MSSLFFFTGVGKDAAAHMATTVAQPVPPSLLSGTSAGSAVGVTVPSNDIRCWGAVPGPSNMRNWDRMQPGDACLIYSTSGQFDRWGTVLDKAHDQAAATALWGTDASGDTWEYMYFLDVQEFPTPVPLAQVRTDLGYAATWNPQGFQFIEPSRQQALVQATGSTAAWIASLVGGSTTGGVPGPPAATALWKPFNPAAHAPVKLSSTYKGPDPDVVGAGLNAHRDMCNTLDAAATAKGFQAGEPKPPAPNYDLRWDDAGATWIAEVKSLTPSNERHQLRLGLGQLLEFLHVHKTIDPTLSYQGALVVSAPPSDVEFWRGVCSAYGVTLVAGTADLHLVGL